MIMDDLNSKQKMKKHVPSDLKHDDIEGKKDDSRKHKEQKEHSQQQKELKDRSKLKKIRKDPSNHKIQKDLSQNQETPKDLSQNQETPKDLSQMQETQKDSRQQQETPKERRQQQATQKDHSQHIRDNTLKKVDVPGDLKHDDIEGKMDESGKHKEQKEYDQQQKELKDPSKPKKIQKDLSQNQGTLKDRSQQQETKKGRSCFPFSLCGSRQTKILPDSEKKLKQQQIFENAFKQQQMWAFRPKEKCTPFIYLIVFIIIGIIFIMVGVGLWFSSEQVHEVSLDYTQCTNFPDGTPCSQFIKKLPKKASCEFQFPKKRDTSCKKASCECQITLDLGSVDWVGPVFIYYGLTNFYQNHRRYVESRDNKQLKGELDGVLNKKCEPFLKTGSEDQKTSPTVLRFAPCGAIANSMFDDTIKIQYKKGSNDWTEVPLLNTGIAWQSDKDVRFRNPVVPENSNLQSVFKEKNFASPKHWSREIWELDTENDDNNGFQNEDLIVWMRTAALSNFRKLYRRIDHKNEKNRANFEADFKKGLPTNGYKYRVVIDYTYDVTQFSGTKSVIISAPSVVGGKNPFLGIAYMAVGCICCIMSIPFIYIHLRRDKEEKRPLSAI